jgi:hypothetical protein
MSGTLAVPSANKLVLLSFTILRVATRHMTRLAKQIYPYDPMMGRQVRRDITQLPQRSGKSMDQNNGYTGWCAILPYIYALAIFLRKQPLFADQISRHGLCVQIFRLSKSTGYGAFSV